MCGHVLGRDRVKRYVPTSQIVLLFRLPHFQCDEHGAAAVNMTAQARTFA